MERLLEKTRTANVTFSHKQIEFIAAVLSGISREQNDVTARCYACDFAEKLQYTNEDFDGPGFLTEATTDWLR